MGWVSLGKKMSVGTGFHEYELGVLVFWCPRCSRMAVFLACAMHGIFTAEACMLGKIICTTMMIIIRPNGLILASRC